MPRTPPGPSSSPFDMLARTVHSWLARMRWHWRYERFLDDRPAPNGDPQIAPLAIEAALRSCVFRDNWTRKGFVVAFLLDLVGAYPQPDDPRRMAILGNFIEAVRTQPEWAARAAPVDPNEQLPDARPWFRRIFGRA